MVEQQSPSLTRVLVWLLITLATPKLLAAEQLKILKVGVKDNAPPLAVRDRSGELVGFEVDLAREIGKKLGVTRLELVPMLNRDRFPALFAQKVDLVIAQVTLTSNRARLVDFTLPYYTDRTVVVTKLANYNQSLGLQQLKSIGVLKGSSAIAALQSVYGGKVVGADSYRKLEAALTLGQVEAIAADYLGLAAWLRANPDYGMVGQPLAFHSLAIAIPRGLQHQVLFQQTSQAVAELRASGWLQQKAKAWQLLE
ncbi:MAG: transporter substrate-binding domain-containing protein [Pseudanabaenaceae cyanobacterium bins.68]|nr:transporter substrate-binding domain-containing protein [Pseudanabaenaceae cyanobacterium bins.68]